MGFIDTIEIVNAMPWGHSVEKEETPLQKQQRILHEKYGNKKIPASSGAV
tara:strand:+ start:26 stop:175 length:150 start_codon:yes stop_codon:yes gene_type:complete